MAERKSIDEQFSESYQNDPRILGPSVGGVSQTRNAKVEYKNDPTVRRGGLSATGVALSPSATAVEYRGGKAANVNAAPRQTTSTVRAVSTTDENGNVVPLEPGQPRRQYRPIRQRREESGGTVATIKGTVRRAKATGTTIGIWSWGFFVWLWFQVPFAVISIAFMALTQAIYVVYTNITVASANDGLLVTAAKYVGNILATGISNVLQIVNFLLNKFLGFDLNSLNPANFFMMTHLTVMIIGWTTLFTAAFVYKLSGSNPIFGKGLSKAGTFLLAMICYAIPIMNLFPWFFIWTLAVMKNPK